MSIISAIPAVSSKLLFDALDKKILNEAFKWVVVAIFLIIFSGVFGVIKNYLAIGTNENDYKT
jgi:hypothetical protein